MTAITEEAPEKALEQIKEVYESNVADINGTEYQFTKFNHMERKKVFAFLSKHVNFSSGDFNIGGVFGDPQLDEIEKLIHSKVLVDGVQISKHKDFWDNDEYAGDYVAFTLLAMQVIAYPFMRGGRGN